MRYRPIWVVLLLVTVASAFLLFGQTPAESDDSAPNTAPVRGVEVDRLYDLYANRAFEQGLSADQRERLVRLNSRYALADSELSLPLDQPTLPFGVRFRAPMGRAFAQQLMAAGATFVGYAPDHTHFVRARDNDALHAIGELLAGNDNVAGTLLTRPIDRMHARVWLRMQEELTGDEEYRVQFWADVDAARAAAMLSEPGVAVIRAAYMPDGTLDMATRHMEVKLTRAALEQFVNSPWIEMVEVYYPFVSENLDSKILHNATESQIGPGTPYNLTGEGIIAGVWDSGRARDTHVGLQGGYPGGPIDHGTRRVLSGWEMMNNPQFSWIDGTVDTSGHSSHATHVVGTVIGDGTGGNGTQGRGYAPRAYLLSLRWDNIDAERRLMRHHFRHVSDNHSYGDGSSINGGYSAVAAESDTDIRDVFIKMTKSAGNEGPGSNTIQSVKGMKNSFTIGAAQDNGDIANFSSRGPANDGRLNVHFMFNGVGLYSADNGSDTHYSSKSGTSMAAPSANGSLVLLSELYKREYSNREMPADLGRAILAATTTDAYNIGPDYRYGFGIGDVKRAADLILADVASGGANLVRGAVRQNEVVEYELEVVDDSEPLRVVLSWLDVWASTNAAIVLVNDLDLELVDPAGTVSNPVIHYPYSGLLSGAAGDQTYQWTNTGPNRRDNLEWIEVPNPTIGTWIVRVTGHSIPSNPQAGVPNDVVGYVLASERPFSVMKELVEDALNTTAPVPIPDNSAAGITRAFQFNSWRPVTGVRLYLDVKHTRRGDISVYLTAPDNTTVNLQPAGSNTRRDLIGILPDTRQYGDDVTALLSQPADGIWTVRITDTVSGHTGEILYLALELDLDPSVPPNTPPVAAAGPTQVVWVGDLVELDAGASFDPDGDPLTFHWMQLTGPTANLTSDTTANPQFIAPPVIVSALLAFQVAVDDGRGGVDVAVVSILVNQPNTPPVADAGQPFTILEGATVQLDGTGSFDPDGDALAYLWTEVGTSHLSFENANTPTATFVAPSVVSTTELILRLFVSDGRGGLASDDVVVTVIKPWSNEPPVAVAGPDQHVTWQSPVRLDGSASYDPEGEPLSFDWQQVAGWTTIQLVGAGTATPRFNAPAGDDTIVLRLTVRDSVGHEANNEVTIRVSEQVGSNKYNQSGSGSSDSGGCASGSGTSLWLLSAFASAALLRRRRRAT